MGDTNELDQQAEIRPARPDEARAISALALRSKAHWPYTPEQLAVFEGELTLAPGEIEPSRAHVAVAHDRLAGFYSLGRNADEGAGVIELEHLFIEPDALGLGLGRSLFEHARDTARCAGYRRMVVQSDPNAAGFYERLGLEHVRDIPSSIPGRSIPFFSTPLRGRASRSRG